MGNQNKPTMTVRELICRLTDFDMDDKVVVEIFRRGDPDPRATAEIYQVSCLAGGQTTLQVIDYANNNNLSSVR